MQSTTSMDPRRLMCSCNIEGALTNNTNNGNKRLPPACILRRLGVQEKVGLEEVSQSKPNELKAALDLLKTKQRPRGL